MTAIEDAAAILARARTGAPIPGLPAALRPTGIEAAEAIQAATLAALGEGTGGWKIGRNEGVVFSAPIPASHLLEGTPPPIRMPATRFIELELALRFHTPVADAATLTPADLPRLAHRATLFEFVRPRYTPEADLTPFDRIADALGNEGALVLATPGEWTLGSLDSPPAVTLLQNGETLSHREAAAHVAAPIQPLLQAWIDRLRREGRGVAKGEVVTLGSLSGMPPIPDDGATYEGRIQGLEPIRCAVA